MRNVNWDSIMKTTEVHLPGVSRVTVTGTLTIVTKSPVSATVLTTQAGTTVKCARTDSMELPSMELRMTARSVRVPLSGKRMEP